MVTRREFSQLVLAGVVAPHLPLVSAAPALAATDLGAGITGTLDAATLAILMASAEAVTGVQPLQGYYEDYYDFQARHRPGRLSLYRDYASRVDRDAKRASHDTFLTCDPSTRVAIVARVRSLLGFASQFEIPIFQETLAVFEKTDAWLQLGYDSWPGSPRSVDAYRQPIGS